METFNAPRRRVDNEISRLTESASALLMHCNILDQVVATYHNKQWRSFISVATTTVLGACITFGVYYLFDYMVVPGKCNYTSEPGISSSMPGSVKSGTHLPVLPVNPMSAVKVLPTASASGYGGLIETMFNFRSKSVAVVWSAFAGAVASYSSYIWEKRSVEALLNTFNGSVVYENMFRQLYQKQISAKDENILALGAVVLRDFASGVNSKFVQSVGRVNKTDLGALHRILEDDIPNLRRRASPNFPNLSPNNITRIASTENVVGFEELRFVPDQELSPEFSAMKSMPLLNPTHSTSMSMDGFTHVSRDGSQSEAVQVEQALLSNQGSVASEIDPILDNSNVGYEAVE
jgi:hypothetical protein